MKKNGEEHLEGIDGFIEQTTKQLEEAKEKRKEIASDLEELDKAFEAESDGE